MILSWILLNFKWFRLYALKRLLKYVENNELNAKSLFGDERFNFLCYFSRKHPIMRFFFFPCWKNIKEVKECRDSIHVWKVYRDQKTKFNCIRLWFYNDLDRINFLNQCITKLESK